MNILKINLGILLCALCLFVSTAQAGGFWGTLNASLDGGTMTAIVTPTAQYAVSNGRGVFKSTDGGSTWSAANQGLTNLNVVSIVSDPITPATLYVSVEYPGGLFKSVDAGTTWVATTPLPYSNSFVTLDPNTPTTL